MPPSSSRVASLHLARVAAYEGEHKPSDEGPPAHDLASGFSPDDILVHPDYYTGYRQFLLDFWRSLEAAQGAPEKKIRIYRALPSTYASFNSGDWVTPSVRYARQHLQSILEGEGHVVAVEVPAHTLRWPADDLMEWGYWGPPVNGKAVR